MNQTGTGISKFSLESLVAAFLAGTNDAYAVIDSQFNITIFNHQYSLFHKQFAYCEINEGQNYYNEINGTLLHFLIEPIQECFTSLQNKKFNHKISSTPEKFYDIEIHTLINSDGKIGGVALGFFDVTQRYKVAEEIKKSELLFKSLVVNATDAFQLTNEELKITYISDSVKNVLGYEAGELLHNNFFNLIHPDDKIIISTWLHWLIHNPGVVNSVELRIRNKNNEWIYIEITGNNLLHLAEVGAVVMNYKNIQNKKIAENALTLAEQRMGLLLNNTKESFIVVNSRLRVITYNRAAQEHSPYFFTNELQSGVSILSLIKEVEVEKTIHTFEKVFEGYESETETIFVDDKNIVHIYNHSFRPLYSDDEIVGVFITSTDITQRKKAEQQLKISEERYKTIIRESYDAIVITDINDIIIETSPAIEKILGYKQEELTGRIFIDLIKSDYREVAFGLLQKIKNTPDEEESMDLMATTVDGDNIWIVVKAKNLYHNKLVKGLVILIRNITKRKKVEEELSLSESRFKSLIQSGSDIISIVNKDGFVSYSSPTVKTILGNDPEKNIGKNIFEYIHPDDIDWVRKQFAEMKSSGIKQLYFGPFRYRDGNDQYRWLETVVTNLLDDPAVNGIVTNSRDVTERKKLTEKQNALREKLVKNNQDLQQFSFITSHNLRAPVANLLGLLNLFNKENISDPFNEVLIEKFEDAANQLNNTLSDLIEILVLKSDSEIPLEEINLKNFTHQILKNIESKLTETETIITTDFKTINSIKYNKVYLESIFQNIITNAIKYRSNERKPVIHISTQEEEQWVIILFKDNGVGIDLNRYKDRVFGMYQRFHSEKEGKGLGLYIVKSQISAMGGKIEVESNLNIGTTFKVYIKKNGKI